jgi:transcriptional regulator with PAS, ATPase and Fis domain
VNKEKTEDFIDKMLVELRQQYDRIQMLKDVFTTKRMKEYTAVLYRLGVEFLYETVRYYSMGTIRRLGHVIARPPSVGVERKVKEIKDAIRETEREMRALDSKKIDDLKKQQQKDMQTLGEVRKIVAGKSYCRLLEVVG